MEINCDALTAVAYARSFSCMVPRMQIESAGQIKYYVGVNVHGDKEGSLLFASVICLA